MSSDQSHRELSSEQLTPAEETFTEFNDVVVKYEEEVDGQLRLLDFTRIPLIILHRIEAADIYRRLTEAVVAEIQKQNIQERKQVKE
ncbi:hypothetical protein AMECASPLE_032858 [Ameca splendens]|uniref:Uncharacterized protein n=1 Tax=Ameca splendens TaxID=208324 RepID=A0ABV0XJL5_9TELE